MKNDLPYFTHDNNARNHPKMKALRAQYGPAGYGLFWILNEMISQAQDARLDLSKKINRTATAGELGMSLEQFDSFLAFLSDPEYDLVNYKDGILTTDRTQEDYAAVKAKRKRDQSGYHARGNSANGNGYSANGNQDSESGNDTEQSRAEQNRKEQQQAALVDNSEEAKREKLAIAIEKAKRNPKIRDPLRAAPKMVDDQDVLDEYRRRHPEPEKDPPPLCPGCGRPAHKVSGTEAICQPCRKSWTLAEEWGWLEDERPWEGDEFEDPG